MWITLLIVYQNIMDKENSMGGLIDIAIRQSVAKLGYDTIRPQQQVLLLPLSNKLYKEKH